MIFASLETEREPPRWAEFSDYLLVWVQNAGTVAAFALAIWALAYVLGQRTPRRSRTAPSLSTTAKIFVVCLCGSLVCYLLFFALLLMFGTERPFVRIAGEPNYTYSWSQRLFLTVGGGLALLAVVVPMLGSLLTRISGRRIWAIARLSLKEAIRGRVIYVFCIMAVVFLFAGWFVSFKPEHQIRNYVMVIYWSMAPLFLGTAALLGAFSIPNDVTKQTIHTIVTKPVERYEIVLGRFLGYGLLLTAALLVIGGLSLIYVVRGVNPAAAQESFKARVPIFAEKLTFVGTGNSERGENVGREWDYRSYIRGRLPGSNEPLQYAVWSFEELPAQLGDRTAPVKFEFTFDIFRTTKGEEDRGVVTRVTFADGRLSPLEADQRVALAREELSRSSEDPEKKWQELVQKYGVYEVGGVLITDYHTQSLEVPAALFKTLLEHHQQQTASTSAEEREPLLKVMVNIDDRDVASRSQRLGMAKRDLYLLAAELPFWQNFLKGTLGLWCNMLLVLGVSVACSTYLSGIISLLCAIFLLGAGLVVEYIKALAAGQAVGGGPIEAANRLFYRMPLAAPLDPSAATNLTTAVDEVYRWLLAFVLKLIPDVHRYNLTDYVANGFDISWGQVILLDNVLPMLGYLLPWGVLAYYLMNSREVANPM